ncbi:hypothetical protein [Streptomyces sp. I5]|uniref:hypothetical protein n=1 Tax=Streptomyces sp. I5 TaxID=2759947 RepID=UPI0018EEA06C|nr:hypothetical protein [Streptomyces sp. I5]MBJ6636614.1 hypothetical protein [Streptomyces sp. I5]
MSSVVVGVVFGGTGQPMSSVVAGVVFGATGQPMSLAPATPAESTVAAMAAATVTAAVAMRFMAGSSVSISHSMLGNLLPRRLARGSRESLGNRLTDAGAGHRRHSPAQGKAPALPTRRTFDQLEREVLAEREMTWQR